MADQPLSDQAKKTAARAASDLGFIRNNNLDILGAGSDASYLSRAQDAAQKIAGGDKGMVDDFHKSIDSLKVALDRSIVPNPKAKDPEKDKVAKEKLAPKVAIIKKGLVSIEAYVHAQPELRIATDAQKDQQLAIKTAVYVSAMLKKMPELKPEAITKALKEVSGAAADMTDAEGKPVAAKLGTVKAELDKAIEGMKTLKAVDDEQSAKLLNMQGMLTRLKIQLNKDPATKKGKSAAANPLSDIELPEGLPRFAVKDADTQVTHTAPRIGKGNFLA